MGTHAFVKRHARFLALGIVVLAMSVAPSSKAQASRPASAISAETAQLRQELAALQADMRQLAESQRRLLAVIEDLRTQVGTLQTQMTASDAGWRERVAQLQTAIAGEGQARVKAIQETIRSVSEEMAATVARLQPAARRTPAPASREYTVTRGDTLSAIAKAFNVPVDELRQANGIVGDLIREGQVLRIP